MMKLPIVVAATTVVFLLGRNTEAFAPGFRRVSPLGITSTPSTTRNFLFDPQTVASTFDSILSIDPAVASNQAMSSLDAALSSSSNLLSFSDQGANLAGTFFQASLLPYLLFLYFLSFRGNRISNLGNFGFQFVLFFVLSTIPSGIISKSLYGETLANVDWLHGGAELLLTVANVLIVLGFKDAMTNEEQMPARKGRNIALGAAAAFGVAAALGPSLGFQAHSEFVFGLGDLPSNFVGTLPWVTHEEPINALSIPTWAIHFSSVFEYLFAMNLVWEFSKTTGNEKWKGMTWGMLPLHASGICACTYHFFYNPSALQFLVTSQAGLTLLGNITCMIAAFRIARSNGWTLAEVNPLPRSPTSTTGIVADTLAAEPLDVTAAPITASTPVLVLQLTAVTLLASYLVKYGELGLDLPFTPNPPVALAMILGIPALTAFQYYQKSNKEGSGEFSLPSFGDSNLSMTDVKKYGVAGTVAYVLTELLFWALAFPAAATALYQSTGHWPDVVNDTGDRAAVLGFIFAGANIARAFVPLRLGAALALAPWVDENLINRNKNSEGEASTTEPSTER